MSDSSWHRLERNIDVNEITIDTALPDLFIEYATILKLRAELDLKSNSENQDAALEYVQFVRAIDSLIVNYKIEIHQ